MNIIGLTFLIYIVVFPGRAATPDTSLGKASPLLPDNEKCINRGRLACETSYEECGGWCPETKQCLRGRSTPFSASPMCPLGESYSGLGYCPRLPAPQCALARHALLAIAPIGIYKGNVLFPCLGFCVPKVNDHDLDWENGVCMGVYDEKCEGSDKQLIIRTSDVPCKVRDTCHTCLYEGHGIPKTEETDSSFILEHESKKCKWDSVAMLCLESNVKIDNSVVMIRRDCPSPDENNPADLLDSL